MKVYCDTHCHTIASTHAYSTLHDYIPVAKTKDIKMFGITDHGIQMPDSPHEWHFGNMKTIPRIIEGVVVLRGIEANICSYHGQLDITPYYDGFLDYAIASFHEQVLKPGSKQENTQAIIGAMESGLIQIIGHSGNPAYPIDFETIVKAGRDNNVLIEINNSSFRHSRIGSGPRCQEILDMVVKHDGKVSFGSDAHIAYDLGNFGHCINAAEIAGLPEENLITQTPERFLGFLTQHGKSVELEIAEAQSS